MSQPPPPPPPGYNVLYYADGLGHESALYRFRNKESGVKWSKDVSEIKGHILSIKTKMESQGRTAGTYDDYRPWLVRCQVFIRTFGKTAVPPDIRRAINSVEEGVGIDDRRKQIRHRQDSL